METNSFIRWCLIGLALISISLDASGQLVQRQVLVSIPYEPAGCGGNSKVSPQVQQQVEMAARAQALALYKSEQPPSRQQLLDRIAPTLQASILDVVPQLQVLSERINRDRKLIEISATAGIDERQIEKLIKQNIPPATPLVERAPMVVIFLAREVSAITTSDGKHVSFVHTNATETNAAGSKGVSVEYNMDDQIVIEYGGKNIEKAQTVEWIAKPVRDVDTAMNEIFSQARYECTDAADISGLNIELFRTDYGAGDDVKPETRQAALKILRGNKVGFFVDGRMDITMPQKSAVSGLPEVWVKVDAKVTDLRKTLPTTVASVGGVYYGGSGPNVQVATQNALLLAARETANKLVDQLRSKEL